MKFARSVKLGAWLLIVLNLLMAFGSIWIFMRMAPAIKVIIAQNEVSLESCEDMLATLAKAKPSATDGSEIEAFRLALTNAQNNITEKEEPATINMISRNYQDAFAGDASARDRTIRAIVDLGTINRDAMRRADVKAQQLGYAGAWGVVFMATFSFMIGMIFLRSLKKNVMEPMHEIDTVVTAFRAGERMRRCSLKHQSRSTRKILNNVNELLDTHDTFSNNEF
jgi:uncharacterized protein YhhL (DUF1145 family)